MLCSTDRQIWTPAVAALALARYGGGYCHELNSVFLSEINSAGLSAKPVLATVKYGKQMDAAVRSHLVLVTELQGTTYLSDIGFGYGTIWPLRLDRIGIVQRQHRLSFMVNESESGYLVRLNHKIGWIDLYHFSLDEASPNQMAEANLFSSISPKSLLSSNLVASAYTRGGRRVLINTKYKYK